MHKIHKNILFLICFIPVFGHSQNLVPNYSFEDTIQCPDNIGEINKTNYWYSANSASPDYFNSCAISSTGTSVPSNSFGLQNPRTGNAYAGIYVFNSPNIDLREYIQIQLLDTLNQEELYHVEFYVCLDNISNTAITEIGMHFSSNPVINASTTTLSVIPQITSPSGMYLNDTVNWYKISGIYSPTGGEKYITIGNFKNDSSTDSISWGLNNPSCFPFCYPASHYYIDDVIVTLDTLSAVNEHNYISYISLFPNPTNEIINLNYALKPGDKGNFMLHDAMGKLVLQSPLSLSQNQLQLNGLNLSRGLYFWNVNINGISVKSDKLIIK